MKYLVTKNERNGNGSDDLNTEAEIMSELAKAGLEAFQIQFSN